MTHGPRALLARAPSNIALIKYMGKTDASANLPENPSLSMTLDGLGTWVELALEPATAAPQALLIPEAPRLPADLPGGRPLRVPDLSAAGKDKVLRHVARSREAAASILPAHGLRLGPARDLALRSANTFPEASGIASSASSFAAITLAVAAACAEDAQAFSRAWESDVALRRALARVSRVGSGSSCRSFEGPWVRWEGEDALAVEAATPELSHFVILVSEEAKAVSSSEAHARVKTSPLWADRPARVRKRLEALQAALARGDLATVARLAWAESWEMHSLFHTSAEPFSYWKPASIDALHWLASFVHPKSAATGAVPIVTMDAGPNVHVIVPRAESDAWRARLEDRFGARAVLEDRPGSGARLVGA